MVNQLKNILAVTVIVFFGLNSYANSKIIPHANDCLNPDYLNKNPHDVLLCAESILPIAPLTYKLDQHIVTDEFTENVYSFTSLSWPAANEQVDAISPNIWTHELDVFYPKKIAENNNTAILYIDGGTNVQPKNRNKKLTIDIDPVLNALIKHAVVSVVKDVPNQYLNINGANLKEDQIIAYTWDKFIHNSTLPYYPLHVPMAVAASQAMTLSQNVLKESNINIEKFVVVGASKRGWTTWMTLLGDKRVVAAIPMVIDILNVSDQINHIYAVYGQHWPIALFDYLVRNIPQYANPANPLHQDFLKLMEIEDPYTYLSVPYFKDKIAAVPKYLLNASGDDFFPPDGSQLYYDQLPGKKLLYYMPNSGHSITKTPALAATLAAFYQRIVNNKPLPVVKWEQNKNNPNEITVFYSEQPKQLTLWQASNPIARDFRFACDIHYQVTKLDITDKQVAVKIAVPDQGWTASYIEVQFADDLLESTPIFISPKDKYPTKSQVMPAKGACLLIGSAQKVDGTSLYKKITHFKIPTTM